jgi:acetyl esterase/lipase
MKLLPLACLALVALCHSTFAAAPGVKIIKDVDYLGAGRKEKLDVYLPDSTTAGKLAPALVWIHGGGWSGGERASSVRRKSAALWRRLVTSR